MICSVFFSAFKFGSILSPPSLKGFHPLGCPGSHVSWCILECYKIKYNLLLGGVQNQWEGEQNRSSNAFHDFESLK